MEGLSYELYPFNIYCKLIEPGGIQTDFWNRSLEITDGVKESPYSTYAEKYLEDMTEPVSSNRSSPDLVQKLFTSLLLITLNNGVILLRQKNLSTTVSL